MKNKELIEQLKRFDENKEVFFWYEDNETFRYEDNFVIEENSDNEIIIQ